ncbi:4-hydroxy-tetrahydrodipicolinate synthase [Virgibacillus profundi]|uniref:4-hydroxy-tetrahydrodipicolinate synthase n=1 Tax=Virgibacillus profundi TaxID=2024555 RepID=A0A2A2I8M3_9BACI|nr:4-hydroxy-tetrahydrodipicolinate synthase [Virgibacillus profundi]PAV28361.1 4-hydroxy-tetrahydrodipicolinate synthase [Virgibacillus profundi]PXY52277.1 4-hydroxy-tetrahydrodipicolinate synthase [Virgibacillus profundi]
MAYEGIMTALVTPLNSEHEVDEEKFRDLINFQIDSNVHSLLVLGGTGEYTSLSMAQKKKVVELAVKIAKGRIPIVVGIIDPGIGSSIEIGLYAKAAGADAVMVVTPYYVRPTQQGIIEYYKKLDETLKMPILLYNIPHKTGVNMLPNTVEEILEKTSNVVGIKECTENFGQMVELINSVGDKITVLAGEEFAAVASMIFGAKGSVMASANVVPELWVKFYNLVQDGETEKVILLNKENYSLFKAVFMEGNPGPLKVALEMKELTNSEINLPLVKASENTKAVLNKLFS